MLRSLIHFRRQHLALALAVAVATAVLAGALVVGDSVRGSLRDLALARLGAIERVVASERPVRDELAVDWSGASGGKAAAGLVARASARHADSGARASRVTVLGVDAEWEAFFPGVTLDFARREGQLFPSVLLSDGLARELGAKVGDVVDLRVPTVSAIPRETLIGRQDVDESIATLRLSVAGLLPEGGLGGFRLDLQQGAAANAVVERSRLARLLEVRGRANLLVASGGDEAERALARSVRLNDLGLSVEARGAEVVIESERLVFADALAARLTALAREAGASPRPVLTYLANRMRRGELEVPYSTVAALGGVEGLEAAGGGPISPLAPGEIALNAWAAEQLDAGVGASVELAYFEVGPRDELIETTATFRVAAIVAMQGLGVDASLTPELPGLSDADRMSDWDPPFPVDLRRIRPVDEDYWERYRAAPKAFVSLADGQRRWGSRFGSVTSLRLSPPPEPAASAELRAARLAERLEETIPRGISPAQAGLALREVRQEALAAGKGATDFAGLFLAFSLFLLAAALLLVGLLERLAVEARAKELGLLGALGFTVRARRRRFVGEAGLVSLLGIAAGLAGAVGFAAAMLHGLRTWWSGAIGTPMLFLHLEPATLLLGGALSLAMVVATLVLAVARISRAPVPPLLAGALGGTSAGRSRRAAWLMASALAGAGGTTVYAILAGKASSPLLAFVAGALVLVAGLAALADRWQGGGTRRALSLLGPAWLAAGARNGGRNRGRSLLASALVACAVFVLTVIAVQRGEADVDLADRSSGTGGFALVAESDVPIVQDLNRAGMREELGLSGVNDALAGSAVYPFRLLPGEDASCLNLYQPRRPRVLGVPSEMIERGGFRFQTLVRPTAAPWRLLEEDLGEDVVPAFADANSAMWILKLGLGDDVLLADEQGRPLRLRLVGLLEKSLFQSELLIAERRFVEHFPSRAGSAFYLVEAPPGQGEAVKEALEAGLERFGFDATTAGDRLRAFAAVESTYLATFQALGGLGLLLGTVGLGIVLLRNVLERRRELAMMSALGFRRGTLSAMILAETLVLLVAGLAVGLISALVATAPHLLAHAAGVPWLPLALTLAAVLAVGCLASLGAVAATARTPLLPALKGE